MEIDPARFVPESKSPAKVFIAGLVTETNTFSPLPTGRRNYAETALFHGDATEHPPRGGSIILHQWRKMAEQRDMQVVESLCTMSQPAGPTVHSVYEQFVEEILSDLAAAMPVDMVLLSLHGAMVSTGCEDCEGDLLERVRKVTCDSSPIGVELDLHCHITSQMLANATVIVTYKKYPHTDFTERATEVFDLCDKTRLGVIHPVTSIYDCKMVNIFRTTMEPMRSFVRHMQEFEQSESVLSVSMGHGFPWSDVADGGVKLLVITNDAPGLGNQIAEQLGRELWSIRKDIGMSHVPMEEALDHAAQAEESPVVIADLADNAGGGAPGDSTFILEEVFKRGLTGVVLCSIWDPGAVSVCYEAGEGAMLDLRIGGKCGPASGNPLDLQVRVCKLRPNATQMHGKTHVQMGDSAWVSCGGVNIILNSIRTQTLGLDAITGFGIDLESLDLIIVKSMHHFHAAFAPIASGVIYASTPGALSLDFASFKYSRMNSKFWPRDTDPFDFAESV